MCCQVDGLLAGIDKNSPSRPLVICQSSNEQMIALVDCLDRRKEGEGEFKYLRLRIKPFVSWNEFKLAILPLLMDSLFSSFFVSLAYCNP